MLLLLSVNLDSDGQHCFCLPLRLSWLTRLRRSAWAALVPGRFAPEPFGLEFELGPLVSANIF